MTRGAVSLYMIATCSLVVVAPGRFVVGLLLAFELLFLLILSSLFRKLLKKMKLGMLFTPSLLLFIVFFTMLYRQILLLWMPELAFQLGFVLYLPSISPFATVFLFDEQDFSIGMEIKNIFKPALIASVYTIIFSFIRDLLGFGTITLPGAKAMKEIVVFPSTNITAFSFLATIPGALVMSSLFLSLYLAVEKKFKIIKESGVEI